MSDSIFALASGGGRAALGVYRLSGPLVTETLQTLSGMAMPKPRQASLRLLKSAEGQIIDQAMILWFPAPASFTGEDVAELHCHGGRAVAEALTEALLNLGWRPAEPGEFSQRAFVAGKLDLTQAEAIADLVAADTAAQRRQALGQLAGALGQLYEEWRARLLGIQAHLEAAIDFAEEDLPRGLIEQAGRDLDHLADQIEAHLTDQRRGERLRDGLRVALLGAPNAGKSSLLNRLSGRDAAIVSSLAGTTRDVIEVTLDVAGYPLILADTAGLRQNTDALEQEGVRRARDQAARADIKILVLDGGLWPNSDAESMALLDQDTLVVLNKSDLLTGDAPICLASHPVIVLSAQSGAGLDQLWQALTARAEALLSPSSGPSLTRARHRSALSDALRGLRRAAQETLPELVAEDVRASVRALGKITGRVDVEMMLDLIFREFCIGK
jgi:tRNA modification GTPase